MPASLDTLPRGHQLPASSFGVSPDWVREYVEATEDEATPALDPDLVPPMALAALTIRSLLESAALPAGALHAGQELAFRRPVRAGERLNASASISGRGERRGWLLVTVDLSVADESGEPVMTGRARVTMTAGADLTIELEAEDGDKPPAQQPGDLPSVTRRLTQEKIDRYARASGDGNPLHTDPQFAARTPFGGTIAHGMLVLAYLSQMMTAAFGDAWPAGGRLKARFRGAARPGDAVTALGRVLRAADGRAVCAVECRNQRGDLLVSGEAEVPL
ncbi:MAG TPA: MaoC family dehydratase [Dehalococcoidia bacterium]|nr:MaoC family dehydratase [Dehalococcoidia bacterium]